MTPARSGAGEPRAGRAALLELTGIGVNFGGITAVDDVSLSLEAGQICGLIGPNGAGKTTLFDVVSGVRRPNSGRVHINGKDVTAVGAAGRSRLGVRRTFQRAQTFGWLTVEDNVLAALEWRGGGGGVLGDLVFAHGRRRRERERRARARTVLDRCGLDGVRHDNAGSLPIGIARMVEFARATAEPPSLLLLDEPASGLSEQESEWLGGLIEAARDETGCAVLLVEHDAAFVMTHSDRVVVLDMGRVLADGNPAQVQADRAVRRAYLGAEVS